MSYIQHVILTYALEREEEVDPLILAIDLGDGQCFAKLRDVKTATHKVWTRNIFVAAVNYLDLDALKEALREIPWHSRARVQLFVDANDQPEALMIEFRYPFAVPYHVGRKSDA